MRCSASLRVALILSGITVLAQAAEAQEKKVGLLIGLPLDVGVFWQTSERVALRADVGFSFNTFESSSSAGLSLGSAVRSTLTTTSSSNSTTIGLSALFTIRNENNLRLYLAPRAAIEFANSSVETEIDPPTSSFTVAGEASGSTRGHEFAVAFGGQYRLRDRLALFGETGLAYRQSEFPVLTTSLSFGGASTSDSGRESRSTSFGLRSAIGLVLFF